MKAPEMDLWKCGLVETNNRTASRLRDSFNSPSGVLCKRLFVDRCTRAIHQMMNGLNVALGKSANAKAYKCANQHCLLSLIARYSELAAALANIRTAARTAIYERLDRLSQ